MVRDELIDLRSNERLRIDFEALDLSQFWCKLGVAYPLLTKRAYCVLVPFVTTYLCESGFSVLVMMKSKAKKQTKCPT